MSKRIKLTKETHERLKEKAEAKGTTPDELAAQIVTEKSGKSTENPAEQDNGKQPFINAYGFLHLNAKMMETIGAVKGAKTPVKIEAKDGTLIISKM